MNSIVKFIEDTLTSSIPQPDTIHTNTIGDIISSNASTTLISTNGSKTKSPLPIKNRISRKANRNLFEDQINFLSITRKKLKLKSDSELLRIIIDRYMDEWNSSESEKADE